MVPAPRPRPGAKSCGGTLSARTPDFVKLTGPALRLPRRASDQVQHGFARHVAVHERGQRRFGLAPVRFERDLRVELAGGDELGQISEGARAGLDGALELGEKTEAVE